MILATKYSGNKEVRSFGPDTSRIGAFGSGWGSMAGETVTDERAVGLAPVGRAIRLVAGSIASQKIRVYEGRNGDKREREDTDQAALLAAPVLGVSDYDWLYDIAAGLEAFENVFLHKRKDAKGVVRELPLIPNRYVHAWQREDGEKVFEIGQQKYTTADILHIRGQTVGGGPFGVSRIYQHRDPLGAQIAAQRFEGAYFQNSARPDLVILYPSGVTKAQHDEWFAGWDNTHGGAGNAGKPHALGGGADVKPIPVSMKDAQFIEGRRMGVEDIGRIMDVDAVLLGADGDVDARKTALELFLRLQLTPRLRRIERALKADPDLFGGTDAYPEFQQDDLMFTDALTKAQVRHQEIQDGQLLVDEARAAKGLPPLLNGAGQIPQITPVGGAPNEAPGAARESIRLPEIQLRVEQDMAPIAEAIGEQVGGLVAAFGEEAKARRVGEDRVARERFMERKQQEKLNREHVEALRQIGSVVVNVEPTPVTVENNVTVEPIPVQLSIDMPAEQKKRVEFERDSLGRIESATVENE